ncbi:terminase gpA endonuclease subunit [Escherichia coli]|uniref:terminase gpA endonuclease subunit n=1 Tax=Escherichia coli TaxID=562 RepID=UPI0039A7418E
MAYLTAGIDSQLDRYGNARMGMGAGGEESWLIDRQIIMGRHDDEQTLLRVDEAINKTLYPPEWCRNVRYPVSAGILAGLTRPLCMNARKNMGCSG